MPDNYQSRLDEQKRQYSSGEEIHDLPQIFHYWSNKYIRPKMEQIFGVSSVTNFYANQFADLCKNTLGARLFVSIGSGACDYEIEIVQELLNQGASKFKFTCLEVSELLVREGSSKIRDKQLEQFIEVVEFDANREQLNLRVDGFMAHHSLHHIVELEQLFDTIDKCLAPGGRFLTMDMIGRNGHMRWPETLRFIESFWDVIGNDKKWNHQHRTFHSEFLNFDCSVEGFEGVRAQDILPLLVQKFSFEAFFGVGGLIEVFVDRGYGPNYRPDNAIDVEFIETVSQLNERLVELGMIKPTIMFAAMRKRDSAIAPKVIGRQTPEHCVRRAG